MSTVFISYRREENAGDARALCNDLGKVLGTDSVFMDVDSIALGRDFREALKERLASSDLMLVLIGKGWIDAKDAAGKNRLDQPDDFVRQEIATALKRNIPVTPVLLHGATVPRVEQLPEDLRDLAFRNGFELSYTRWQSDIGEMIKRLGLAADQAPRPPQPIAQGTPGPTRGRNRAIALGALAVAAVAGGYFILQARLPADYATGSAPPIAGNAPAGHAPAAGNDPAAPTRPNDLTTNGAARSFVVMLSSDTTIGAGGAKDELGRAQAFAQTNFPDARPLVLLRNHLFATGLLFSSQDAANQAVGKLQQFHWKDAYVANLRAWCPAGVGREPATREGISFINCMP